MDQLLELNVGGVLYTTSSDTLLWPTDSWFDRFLQTGSPSTGAIETSPPPVKDSRGRYFIDRDGVLFRYVLDFLRNRRLVLPDNFQECERLQLEADFFRLPQLSEQLSEQLRAPPGSGVVGRSPGCITVGYRGTFAFGRDGLADVKFRKLSRIMVSGRVTLCREAFGDTLNESRDPDRGHTDRYTCRFYLKHTFLEQAFDMLRDAGFRLTSSCGSGTAAIGAGSGAGAAAGSDTEESRWNHYNEFVFFRE